MGIQFYFYRAPDITRFGVRFNQRNKDKQNGRYLQGIYMGDILFCKNRISCDLEWDGDVNRESIGLLPQDSGRQAAPHRISCDLEWDGDVNRESIGLLPQDSGRQAAPRAVAVKLNSCQSKPLHSPCNFPRTRLWMSSPGVGWVGIQFRLLG